MGPKSKKINFKPFKLEEVQQKEVNLSKTEVNTKKSKHQKGHGNPRYKDVLHPIETIDSENKPVGIDSNECESELKQNIDKSSKSYLLDHKHVQSEVAISGTSYEAETETFTSHKLVNSSSQNKSSFDQVSRKSKYNEKSYCDRDGTSGQWAVDYNDSSHHKRLGDEARSRTQTQVEGNSYKSRSSRGTSNDAYYGRNQNSNYGSNKKHYNRSGRDNTQTSSKGNSIETHPESFFPEGKSSSVDVCESSDLFWDTATDNSGGNAEKYSWGNVAEPSGDTAVDPSADTTYDNSWDNVADNSWGNVADLSLNTPIKEHDEYYGGNRSSNYGSNKKCNNKNAYTSPKENSKRAHNDGNYSENGSYTRVAERKSDIDNWKDVSKFHFHQKMKSSSGYRKSESFVTDRRENQGYSRRSDSYFSRPFLSEDFADPDYCKFQKEVNESEKVIYEKVNEIEKDLFSMSEDYSLGHCVAADMRMGSGIAVTFKKQFGNLGKLLSQNQGPGGLAVLELNGKVEKRYIYYLVTKQLSNGKPTYGNFWSSLKKMRDHICDNGVKKLAIPKIGCGLDKLEWSIVKHMIEFLFQETDVDVTVCNFLQSEDAPTFKDNTCKVVYDESPVAKIDNGTIIIYFSTEKGEIEEHTMELTKKFTFLDNLKKAPKKLGDAVRHEERSKNYILYGCIVRKTMNSDFNFESFAKCLSQIKKDNKKDQFYYLAYQSITDKIDLYINDKIITLLRNLLRDVDVYVCKTKSPVEEKPHNEQYNIHKEY